MSPIAAYYVMVVSDLENEKRTPKYATPAPKQSRAARLVAALETLVNLGRPATTQPV